MARAVSCAIVTLYLLAICHPSLADTSNAAIAQTLQQASNNPQVANTNAWTSAGAPAPVASVAAVKPASSGTAQPNLPTSLQASDVNNALLQATQLATQVIQNVPPATG